MRAPLAALLLLLLTIETAHAAERSPAPVLTRYRLGLLYRNPNLEPLGKASAESLQAGHMANIRRMGDLGVMLAAGPFGDNTPLRGIFVFTGDETVALDSLLAHDPLLSLKRLRLEMHGWMAPVGIGQDYRRRVDDAKRHGVPVRDSMVSYTMVLLRRGPQWTSNLPPRVARTLKKQREYAEKLRRDGRLILESAVEGSGDLRGMYLFRADTTETVRFMASDPAVRAGRFRPEIHPWWVGYGIIPGH